MNPRVFIAGFLGAVAMFVWMFIAHMVLPLGEAGVNEIANEPPVLSALATSLGTQNGVYLFPGSGLPPNATSEQRNASMKEYSTKLASSPSGMLVYHGPGATFNFPKLLGTEFLLELVESLLAAWLLAMTALTGIAKRTLFVTVVGVIAAIATNGSYWNWYGFPGGYTASYMFTQTMGFLCAGVAIAWIMRSAPRSRVRAA